MQGFTIIVILNFELGVVVYIILMCSLTCRGC